MWRKFDYNLNRIDEKRHYDVGDCINDTMPYAALQRDLIITSDERFFIDLVQPVLQDYVNTNITREQLITNKLACVEAYIEPHEISQLGSSQDVIDVPIEFNGYNNNSADTLMYGQGRAMMPNFAMMSRRATLRLFFNTINALYDMLAMSDKSFVNVNSALRTLNRYKHVIRRRIINNVVVNVANSIRKLVFSYKSAYNVCDVHFVRVDKGEYNKNNYPQSSQLMHPSNFSALKLGDTQYKCGFGEINKMFISHMLRESLFNCVVFHNTRTGNKHAFIPDYELGMVFLKLLVGRRDIIDLITNRCTAEQLATHFKYNDIHNIHVVPRLLVTGNNAVLDNGAIGGKVEHGCDALHIRKNVG